MTQVGIAVGVAVYVNACPPIIHISNLPVETQLLIFVDCVLSPGDGLVVIQLDLRGIDDLLPQFADFETVIDVIESDLQFFGKAVYLPESRAFSHHTSRSYCA